VSTALIRAVVDASVLVERWSRLALSLTARHQPDRLHLIWTEWVIGEAWRVLAVRWVERRGLGAASQRALSDSANAMMLALLTTVELVPVAPPFVAAWSGLGDANDNPVWTAAVRARAGFVVSHNVHHFPPRDRDGLCQHDGIEFITAENLLREVLGLHPMTALGDHLPTSRVRHQRRA
jgi:hypothetical protein